MKIVIVSALLCVALTLASAKNCFDFTKAVAKCSQSDEAKKLIKELSDATGDADKVKELSCDLSKALYGCSMDAVVEFEDVSNCPLVKTTKEMMKKAKDQGCGGCNLKASLLVLFISFFVKKLFA